MALQALEADVVPATPSFTPQLDCTAPDQQTPAGGWVVEREPTPHVTWRGGQDHFPGGWLQLAGEQLRHFSSGLRLRPSSQGTGSAGLTHPLVWSSKSRAYREETEGGGFQATHHSLDRSPETLELAVKVAGWRDQVAGWQQASTVSEGQKQDRGVGSSADGRFYVKIATALADKLNKTEEETKQDYASDVIALHYGGSLVGVMDCYERTKTKAMVLKYALAHPDSQQPAGQRPEGTVGGVGRACLAFLAGRAGDLGVRSLRMEALSLRLYLSASANGFASLGTTLPPMPAVESAD